MPRISDIILDAVIYLYESEDAAKAGERVGGSGFLVGWKTKRNPPIQHVYAVTNAHVVHGDGTAHHPPCPVVRLNTKEGKWDILPLAVVDWCDAVDGTDLAVARVDLDALHQYRVVGLDTFLTRQIIRKYNIGPGDDCFMVGRFINHEGRQRNTPTLRFGNLSMMPWEPVKGPCAPQESFLVEMRSRSGYSGSPIFVYIPPSSVRMDSAGLDMLSNEMYGPWLLGVDWGQIPSLEQDRGVPIGSGMLAAVPAWRLMELLMKDDEVVRRRLDAERREIAKGGAMPEVATVEPSEPKADNPNHKEDFTRLLNVAAQKREQED